jgi:two-component sensor histidine kinase/sugar lactone lactonase YvrE
MDQTHSAPKVAVAVFPHDFAQSEWINQLFETSDHKLWAATARGLLEYFQKPDAQGKFYRVYTTRNGLSDHSITSLVEDTGNNLWLGSGNGAGVMRFARHGFVTYDESEGVTSVQAIFPDRAGGVCFRGYVLGDKHASIFDGGRVDVLNLSDATFWPRLGRFDGQRLTWFLPEALKGKYLGWVGEGVTVQSSRSGDWWMANGLYHFPAADNLTQLKSARPLAYFGTDTLIGARQIWRLFEDSHDRVWISIFQPNGNGLLLWDPGSQSLRDLGGAANLPSLQTDLARSFAEDSAGNIWIGFNGGLARFREESFTYFGPQNGVPPGGVMDIHFDTHGHLWFASSRSGLVRVDGPDTNNPSFSNFTSSQGLSGDVANVITEDLYGRIYVATGHGLDRFDPGTSHVKHYTTADGLANGNISAAFRDSSGSLWFGTSEGLSRFLPENDEPSLAPPVLLTSLSVSGVAQNVSALGETDLRLPDLSSGASRLQIDFVGLGFALGESLRYRYMLEGADRDWSPPTVQRTVTYARLTAGHYRFLVQAINADGQVSPKPAVIMFHVLPPVWMRWWFLTLVALLMALLVYVIYRYRVTRLLEVANMRTSIATDLHDDIGANLTRISILSEVAKQQFGSVDKNSPNLLTSIAEIARESVASMSDIVWAINPERDSVRDLIRKMRQLAEEVFTTRDIALSFNAPDGDRDFKLGADVRRDFLLIFKEAINNAARHSGCSSVRVDILVAGSKLCLEVSDNGKGFDPASAEQGHGLKSMRQRAERLGGSLKLDTNSEKGTTITATVSRTTARVH